MRINVYATEEIRNHKVFEEFERLIAAAGAMVVGHAKARLGHRVDVQVNTIPMSDSAGQFIFMTGESFEVAPAGRSHLTMEIDHVDDLRLEVVNNDLLCYMVCAVASALFPRELMENVNCWSKRHGHADQTGWHEGRVDASSAGQIRADISRFIDDPRLYANVLLACVDTKNRS